MIEYWFIQSGLLNYVYLGDEWWKEWYPSCIIVADKSEVISNPGTHQYLVELNAYYQDTERLRLFQVWVKQQ